MASNPTPSPPNPEAGYPSLGQLRQPQLRVIKELAQGRCKQQSQEPNPGLSVLPPRLHENRDPHTGLL